MLEFFNTLFVNYNLKNKYVQLKIQTRILIQCMYKQIVIYGTCVLYR